MFKKLCSISAMSVLLLLVSVVVVLAAPPHVRPGSAVVNGSSSEWDTTTGGPDFFMYGCGGSSGGNTTGCNDLNQTPHLSVLPALLLHDTNSVRTIAISSLIYGRHPARNSAF